MDEEKTGKIQTQGGAAVEGNVHTTTFVGHDLHGYTPEQTADLINRVMAGPQPTDQTLIDYLNWVVDQHLYLDPRGSMQTVRQVQVRLDEVYVSLTAEIEPTLNAHDRRLYEQELQERLAGGQLRTEEAEDLRENLLARYLRGEPPPIRSQPIDLGELVRQHAKLVVLGDPGAGKTTLLRYLALQHAQALQRGEQEVTPSAALSQPGGGSLKQTTAPINLGPARLPLFLRIADYAEHGRGRSLRDFLPANLRGEDDEDTALAAGACLVLLDGLDEITEPDQRAEIAQQIDGLIRHYEKMGNRFVVSSRVAGYRSAPLAGDLPHYRLCDMDDEQIQRFLTQWCHAVEHFQTPDLSLQTQAQKAQGEIDSILAAVKNNPGVRRLAANPLLLRTLALIHRTGARLPQRRIELYRLAADTLIRDWQLARGIPQAALVNEAEATRLLSELAAWMHGEKPAGIATHGEVRQRLAEVKARLSGQDADHPAVLAAVDDFLLRIRQHTGLFVESAPRRASYIVVHLWYN